MARCKEDRIFSMERRALILHEKSQKFSWAIIRSQPYLDFPLQSAFSIRRTIIRSQPYITFPLQSAFSIPRTIIRSQPYITCPFLPPCLTNTHLHCIPLPPIPLPSPPRPLPKYCGIETLKRPCCWRRESLFMFLLIGRGWAGKSGWLCHLDSLRPWNCC